ncbi:hypothetical protein PF594_10035 [Lactobacillus delbrueckii]|nr:hypothetical protein [Lactobacillus delbrueckii]
MTAFTGVDSQNLPDVMVSVQFILAIGDYKLFQKISIPLAAFNLNAIIIMSSID